MEEPELAASVDMTSAGYDIWDEIVMEALMPGGIHARHMAGQGGGH